MEYTVVTDTITKYFKTNIPICKEFLVAVGIVIISCVLEYSVNKDKSTFTSLVIVLFPIFVFLFIDGKIPLYMYDILNSYIGFFILSVYASISIALLFMKTKIKSLASYDPILAIIYYGRIQLKRIIKRINNNRDNIQ